MATYAETRTAGRAATVAGLWRGDLAVAWRALWVSRLLVWGSGLLALGLWGVSPRAADFDPQGLTAPFGAPWDALLAPAARWDTVWFLMIAEDGYGADDRTAFFPLFGLLARLAGLPLGSSLLGAVLVAWVCALAGLAVVHRLAALELRDPRAARLAVWALALFPASGFLTAAYSESLFLALSAGALLAARTDRWTLAGGLGAAAAATRSAGIVLAVALALLWWDAWRAGRARPGDLLRGAGLVPCGLAAFCLALWAQGIDPGAPFHAQETWFRTFAGPFGGVPDGLVAAWDGARQLLSGSREPVLFTPAGGDPFAVAGHNLKNAAVLVLFALPALVGAARRLPPAYAAYALAALALPLSYPVTPQPLMSLPRFVLVLVPLFLACGAWLAAGPRWRERAVLGAFAAGLVVLSAQFACWRFVA